MRSGVGMAFPLLLLAGCMGSAVEPAPAFTSSPAVADWRKVATTEDRRRLREWRTAFVTALNQARASGHAPEIAKEGALLNPDAAIAGADIPAGNYRCRVIKVGANGTAVGDYTAYPAFDCRVSDEGEVSSFAKVSGSQRPVGLIFDDDSQRQIFLGTLMLGDERSAIDYGRDADRDMAGAIEKIGEKRWRMVLPYPRFESLLDVIELVPQNG